MNTHDPRKILEALRNHLTQSEGNLAFLFGAGTSCAVRVPVSAPSNDPVALPDAVAAGPQTRALIPNVAELTNVCVKEIQKLDPEGELPRFGSAYTQMEAEIRPADRITNIEDILSCVRRKLHAVGNGDTLAGLTAQDLRLVETTIQHTIAAQVNPDTSSFPSKLPHEEFVRWVARIPRKHPVEIFTTNYDVLIEMALEAERVPSFDGFVGCNRPFFSHESLTRPEHAPGSAWTRLWKIHGSINWRVDTVKGKRRVVRTDPHNEGEMILPSHHKYDESRKQPYSALLDRFTKVLDREDTILFVCGYSFSDDHINAIIFDALEAKQRPHVIALQYDEVDVENLLANRALRHLNLMVLGPRSAYVGGRHGEWKLDDVAHASTHISQAFEFDEPVAGEPPTGKGKLKLGDFANFAEFLGLLTRVN